MMCIRIINLIISIKSLKSEKRLLTLSAHAREGYSSHLSVILSLSHPVIVANRPYLGGTVLLNFLPSLFFDCVPIFLTSLNVQNSATLSPILVVLTIFNRLA